MTSLFRSYALLFIAIAGSAPLFAKDAVQATQLPAATLLELAAVPAPPPMARENRHDDGRRVPHGTPLSACMAEEAADSARFEITTSAIAAPPIGLAFDSDTSRNLSPADASGAVSRSWVVSASNAGISIHTRNGSLVVKLTLSQFWRNTTTIGEFYDPRLAYDEGADRWITIAIEAGQALMVGVSGNGDPTGSWTRYEIPLSDCDFTRIALTRDTVMVNTFIDGYLGQVFSLLKSELYTAKSGLTLRTASFDSATVPVEAPDSAAEFIIEARESSLYYKRLDEASWHEVRAGFTWAIPFEDTAPQQGTNVRLDLGYGDIQTAVFRGGFIYVVHRIGASPKSEDGNALLWWKFEPEAGGAPTMGVIDAPSPGTILAYPSLAVNRAGGMLISYTVLSSTSWPSSEYVYRDPFGKMSAPAVIRTGNSAILNTDRWGDYTTTVVDPINGVDFWAMQIYSNQSYWQSRWANIRPPGKGRAVRAR